MSVLVICEIPVSSGTNAGMYCLMTFLEAWLVGRVDDGDDEGVDVR